MVAFTEELDVLVIPSRVTSRLSDLSPSECSDLFLSVQTVSRALEKRYDAKFVLLLLPNRGTNSGIRSMTIAIQDGPLAGQTVPHLHVHVMPRFKGDFDPLDKVYDALDELDLSAAQKEILAKEERKERVVVDDEKRFARTKEVMDDEARELSLLFPLENRGQ